MASYPVISSDDHVFEPADLWTSRLDKPFRDRAPHVIHRDEDDTDWWVCDGLVGLSGGSGGSLLGKRFDESPDKLSFADKIENVRPGAYLPEERLKDMDADGIDLALVYPTQGLLLYSVPDSTLLTALCKAYNDWLVEFCGGSAGRIKGIAMLDIDDIGSAIREIERCAKLGLVGAMISVYPAEENSYDRPEYEPFWSAAEDLRMPLSLHIVTNRPAAQTGQGDGALRSLDGPIDFAALANADHWVRMSLARMILSGVFERHPRLQAGSIEQEVSWAPHFIERLDYTYTQRPQSGGYRFGEAMLPSDYFRRNVFISFQEDAVGLRERQFIGVDNLLWGSDYPHAESTFPRSQQILTEILADCTEEEKAKIVGGNTARIYNLG